MTIPISKKDRNSKKTTLHADALENGLNDVLLSTLMLFGIPLRTR